MSMNSFNNITKVKYEKSQKDLVSLVEYILFDDERNKDKYLVFKFQNNVNQYLNEIKFEISQYDEDNNLIAKSVISHGGFVARENEVFVPNCKLKADSDCAKISAKLLLARFERVVWENGAYTPIPYTASEFRNDYYRPVPDKPTKSKKLIKAEQKVEYKQFKKLQKQFNKRKNLSVKSIIKRNKTKFPVVFSTMLSVILLAAVGIMSFIESQKSNVYFDGTYDYTVYSNGVYITDYEGNDDVVVLPVTYTVGEEELPVIGVGAKAFKDTNISTIIFQVPVTIGDHAFEGCKNLVAINGASNITAIGINAFKDCTTLPSVKFENVSLVSNGAFEGCTSLISATLPNATLDFGCFKGATSLMTLDYKTISANNSLNIIFGQDEDLTKYSLRTVKTSQVIIPANFTEGLSTINKIEFKASNPKIQFGALSGANLSNYVNNGSLEILNGKIVSVKDETNVVIPSNVDINEAFKLLHTFADKLQTLTIDYSGPDYITKEHLAPLYNLSSITIGKNTRIESDFLSSNSGIFEIGLSLDSKYISSFEIPSSVSSLIINDTTMISESGFNKLGNLNGITTLKINDDVKSFIGSPFTPFTNLLSLTIPNYFNNNVQLDLSSLGVTNYLNSLKITNLANRNSLKLVISGYSNLNNVDISESGITNLGLTISNCHSLYQIKVPETVTTISNTLVESCQISELVIPSTVTSILAPLIGKDCYNLRYVEVPFVGKNASTTSLYKDFNLSYASTNELIITNEMKGNTSLMLSDCTNLQSLQINASITSLNDLFGADNVVLSQLVVSTPIIDDKTIGNAQIGKLFIVNVGEITPNALSNISGNSLIYLPSIKIAENINYAEIFADKVTTIYINGEMPETANEYSKFIRTNVNFEKIISYLYKKNN